MKKKLLMISPLGEMSKQLLRIMRLTVLMSMCFVLYVAGSTYSQTTKLSLKLSNSTVKEVLNQVEEKSEFFFLYKIEELDENKKVSIDLENASIQEILDKVLKGQNLTYDVYDRQIIIRKSNNGYASLNSPANQSKTISGTVSDQSGSPLPAVTVIVKGTTQGTITDVDGNYSLLNVPSDATLVFSFVGMKTQEIPVAGKTSIDVILAEDAIGIEEVVAVGYGTRLKKDIVGSVSVVDVGIMESIPSGSVVNALQGQASGVTIVNSGTPGGSNQITVRGMTSFGNNNPLILVDGVESNLNSINIDEVETVQVLKDAGSAAIYGVRGSNGVILVTTKRAKPGTTVVSYNGYTGVTIPESGNPLNLTNSEEWWEIMQMGFSSNPLFQTQLPDYMFKGPGIPAQFGFEDDLEVNPSNYVFNPSNFEDNYIISKVNKTGTDWYHELFKPAIQNNHTVTVSGGTEKTRALLSLNYLDENGAVIETFNKRFSARINTDFKISENIRIGENLNVYTVSQNTNQFSWAHMQNVIGNILSNAPINPVFDISGKRYVGSYTSPFNNNQFNPVYIQKEKNKHNKNSSWVINGKVFAEIDFLKHFTSHSSFGGQNVSFYRVGFTPVDYTDAGKFAGLNSLSESSGYNRYWILTNTLKYKNSFRDHNIELLVGSEAIEHSNRSVSASRKDFYVESFSYLLLNNGKSEINNGSSASEITLFSLFGRLDYSYRDKYLLGATIRRDGSSRFGAKSRHGVFPSLSIGWRLSNESFMQDITWIDDLKLRASYGELGSESNVSPANAFNLYGSGTWQSFYSITGTYNQSDLGFYESQFGNAYTSWETDIITNIGLDAVLFGKLDLTVDVYDKSISGLLFQQALPHTVGGAARPYVNIGDVENYGFDFAINYRDHISKDFNFKIGANVTHYVNEIVGIPGESTYFDVGDAALGRMGKYIRNQVGHSMGEFYGYEVERLFQSEDDVASSPTQQAAAPGRFKYKDINGDSYEDGEPNGSITSLDRTFIGSPHPKFTYGINIGINYKNFDFSTVLYGSYGNKVINLNKTNTYFSYYKWNLSRDLLNQWSPTNTSSDIPAFTGEATFSSGIVPSSFYVEDGSYLKMRTLVLGYTLPVDGFLEKVKINRFRVYVQATNVFQITKYSGLDPEIPEVSVGRFGVDAGNYPNNLRGINIGVNLEF